MFDQADGSLEAYDPSIQDDDTDTDAVCLRQYKTWPCKLDRQADIRTIERMGKKFALSHVEETWVVCLKNEATIFKHVTLRNLLYHIGATSMGGEAIYVI